MEGTNIAKTTVVTHETDVKVFRVHIPSILHVAVVGAASLWPFLSECSSGV